MLLKSGIVLYRCFWRVLTSVLCMVMHILCINTLKLLSGFFWDKVWLFLVKTGWQPCVQCSTLYYCRSTAKRVLFWRKINFFPVLQFRSTFVNYLWHKSWVKIFKLLRSSVYFCPDFLKPRPLVHTRCKFSKNFIPVLNIFWSVSHEKQLRVGNRPSLPALYSYNYCTFWGLKSLVRRG